MNYGTLRSVMLHKQPWRLVPANLNHHSSSNSLQTLDPHQRRRQANSSSSRLVRPSERAFCSSARRPADEESVIPHISVHIAASSSGKGAKFVAEKSTFDYDPAVKPALGLQRDDHSIFQKRRARPDSGQDAYFVARVGQDSGETAFGICDGVGGWSDHGIDPADFSHGLCSYMAQAALKWQISPAEASRLKPQQLLELGYQGTVKDSQIRAGGSTACVGITDKRGRLRIANLGDSGFVQLRLGSVQNHSTPQTHAFNTPFQMSLTPPEILAQAMIFGGLPLNDLPERADLGDHQLQGGDVVVLATDGVWDNLSSQDILNIVSRQMRHAGAWERTSDRGYVVTNKLRALVDKTQATSSAHALPGSLQSIIAASIAGEAKSASLNRKRDGPFAKAWQKHVPYDPYHGGKVDDIAVMVVIPVESADAATPRENQAEASSHDQLKAKL